LPRCVQRVSGPARPPLLPQWWRAGAFWPGCEFPFAAEASSFPEPTMSWFSSR
jgi:hypothetical protein